MTGIEGRPKKDRREKRERGGCPLFAIFRGRRHQFTVSELERKKPFGSCKKGERNSR